MDRSDLESEAQDPLIGTMIGRYRVEQKIGQGGMGAVYELLQPAIHKRMALKLLHEEYAGRQEIVRRFFDEARAVNLIGHPSIVDITDFSHLPDGRPFIIMEFLQGESLEDYLQEKGALPESEVLGIFQQICSALDAAHAKQIVHRDLKPENIFLVRNAHQAMQVKVLDFGIAKLKDQSTDDGISQTQTGVVLGTPTYMSPEQAQGKTLEADHRTDVYSLGVMLYQMLAGSPPFQGETFASLIFKHISEVPPKLGDMRSDAAPEWTGIVAKALSKAPDDRYQSVQALLNDARSAFPAAGDSATAMATQEDPNAAPERTTKSFSTLPAIASVLVLGGALAFWNARTNTKKHDKAKGPSIASVPAKDAPAIALDPVAEARATPIAAPVGSQASDDATASTSPNPVDSGVVPESPRATDKPKDPGSKTRARGTGLLRVTAFPWAHVYLDGRRIGQTPLSLSVPAGKHKLRLRNDATGVSKSHRFTMKKGGEKTIREKW